RGSGGGGLVRERRCRPSLAIGIDDRPAPPFPARPTTGRPPARPFGGSLRGDGRVRDGGGGGGRLARSPGGGLGVGGGGAAPRPRGPRPRPPVPFDGPVLAGRGRRTHAGAGRAPARVGGGAGRRPPSLPLLPGRG